MEVSSFKKLCDKSEGVNSPFLELGGKVVSHDAFREDMLKIASVPTAYGLSIGTRILVSLKNESDLITASVGLIAAGMTVILVDPQTKGRRLKTIADMASVAGWLVDQDNAVRWDLPKGVFTIGIHEEKQARGLVSKLLKKKETEEKLTFQKWLSSLQRKESFPEIPAATQAMILFTSGSTSAPKGVPMTHKNILAHLQTLGRVYEMNYTSATLNVLPLYHVDGFIQGPLLTLFSSARLVRPFKFEVNKIEELFYAIYKYRISHFFVVPTILQLLLKFGNEQQDAFETEDFKFLISSAGALDATLWMNFESAFNLGILNVYGLTESVAGGLFCKPKDGKCKAGSIGKPVDIEVRIIDEDGEAVADDQVGELLMRGENVMNNYLVPNGNPDSEGWFHTGDLVFRDADGFYFIKGRKKNVIIRGGVNVYAEEVVETINMHPKVKESFVLGVADEVWGERLVAVVSTEAALTQEQLVDFLRDETEERNVPDSVVFVEDLPKGDSGKIRADAVRDLVANKQAEKSGTIPDTDSDDLKATILSIASDCFSQPVTADQYSDNSMKVEGWNSLAHLQLATLIEKHFEIKLSVKDIMNITSLREAEQLVKRKLA